jgi:hypothetical protein
MSLELFGVQLPIIQAPMAGAQGSELAIAVSNADALAALRKKAESLGRGDFSPLWCGQNVSGCREIPAAALTRALMK